VKIITIGIVDYGMGNHASVAHSLRDLGYRVRISKEPYELDLVDALILPGVGAFPAAMEALYESKLVTYLKDQAHLNRPLIGICLGMQLLTTSSCENKKTDGLDLIPGEIVSFSDHRGHIGWNTLECIQDDTLLNSSDGQSFYFNHSFYYKGPSEFQIATSQHSSEFAAVIRRGNVIGLQFHPEKSQATGKALIKNIISGLVDA
jgi:imidazole glycerol-phosphate synthase subunit HisH